MAKSKHNQVHTGNQPGKADYHIASLLPVGKENAISTAELVRLTGCTSARELQQHIASERKAGAVICSSSAGGYFLPANHEEMAEFCKILENRAKNTLMALRSTRRALNVPEGQQDIKDMEALKNGQDDETVCP